MNLRTSSSFHVERGARGPSLTLALILTRRHGFFGRRSSSTAAWNAELSLASIARTVVTLSPVPGLPPRARPSVSA